MGGGMTDLKSWRDPLPDDDTLVDVMLNHGEWVIGIAADKATGTYQPFCRSMPESMSHGSIYRWRIHNAES